MVVGYWCMMAWVDAEEQGKDLPPPVTDFPAYLYVQSRQSHVFKI